MLPLDETAARFLAAHGMAMLSAAVERGEVEAVRALLKAGVSARGKTPSGVSVLQALALAETEGAHAKEFPAERWSRIRALLEDNGAEYDVLAATGLGDLETARHLLSANNDLIRARG